MAHPSTAAVVIRGVSVPITAVPGLDVAAALSCTPFKDWVHAMDPALHVQSLHFTDIDMFGKSRVGFLKFTAKTLFNGHSVPGIVFMRGGAVSVLPILRCGAERFVLCCRQPRVAVPSSAFLEIPAGMLDGSGNFSGVAAKEMEEETGLVMPADALVDLTELAFQLASSSPSSSGGGPLRGMYPSVGACDEFLRLMLFSKEVTVEEMAALRGKATGCIEDGEVITLEIVPYDALWRLAPDAKTLCSLFLYEKLLAAGMLKV